MRGKQEKKKVENKWIFLKSITINDSTDIEPQIVVRKTAHKSFFMFIARQPLACTQKYCAYENIDHMKGSEVISLVSRYRECVQFLRSTSTKLFIYSLFTHINVSHTSEVWLRNRAHTNTYTHSTHSIVDTEYHHNFAITLFNEIWKDRMTSRIVCERSLRIRSKDYYYYSSTDTTDTNDDNRQQRRRRRRRRR